MAVVLPVRKPPAWTVCPTMMAPTPVKPTRMGWRWRREHEDRQNYEEDTSHDGDKP